MGGGTVGVGWVRRELPAWMSFADRLFCVKVCVLLRQPPETAP